MDQNWFCGLSYKFFLKKNAHFYGILWTFSISLIMYDMFFPKKNYVKRFCIIMMIFYEPFFIKKLLFLLWSMDLIYIFLWTLYYYYYYYSNMVCWCRITSEQNPKHWPKHVGDMTHYWDILPFRIYQYIKSDLLLFFDEQWLTPVMYYMSSGIIQKVHPFMHFNKKMYTSVSVKVCKYAPLLQ